MPAVCDRDGRGDLEQKRVTVNLKIRKIKARGSLHGLLLCMLPSGDAAGNCDDVRQAAGDGFAVDADLGGGIHLREPAHDIKPDDLLIDQIKCPLVSDALPVAAREVFQLLRQSQPRSYAFVTPFGPPPGGAYFSL